MNVVVTFHQRKRSINVKQIVFIMKKLSFILFGVLFAAFSITSCAMVFAQNAKGNGNIVTRDYPVSNFNELSTTLPAIVNFTVGESYSCKLTVDENLLEYIDIKTEKETLQLQTKRGARVNLMPTKMVIDITAPTLEEIDLAGSGDINILTPLENRKMEIDIAGSGSVVFQGESKFFKLDLEIAGSGSAELPNALVNEADISIAGSGEVVLAGLVKDAEVEIAGSGDVDLTGAAIEKLEYSIAGSGNILYSKVANIHGDRAGSGDVIRK